jgi:hypothetical protein
MVLISVLHLFFSISNNQYTTIYKNLVQSNREIYLLWNSLVSGGLMSSKGNRDGEK